MAEFFTGRYRWTILVAVVLLSGFAVSQYSSLRINPGFEDYLPAHISNRAGMDSLSRVFGGNERALVMLQHPEGVLSARHLQALADLSRAFMAMEGVAQCRSLLDVSEPQLDEEGFTTIVPLVDPATLTGTDAVLQKERLRQHPLARRFIAADFSTSALIVTRSPDSDDGAFTEGLRELGSRHAHGGVLHYGGQAFLRQSVKHYIQRDLLLLMPLSLTVMLLLLYFSFREWKGVLLPFLVVVLSLVIAFGFMGLMSWELSLVSVLLPVMLMAIANDYGIHLINMYQEKRASGHYSDSRALTAAVHRALSKPVLLTGLTTIGGLLGLLAHQMQPAAQLGWLSAFGIGIALVLSLSLLPALLTFYPLKKPSLKPEQDGLASRVLGQMAQWVNRHPKRVVLAFVLVSLLSTGGFFTLKIDTNIEDYFPAGSQTALSTSMVNEQFGGSQYVSILFGGEVLSADALDRFARYSEALRTVPEVGHVLSPDLFFRELSKGLYGPEEGGYNALPASSNEARQYVEVAALLGYGGELSQLLSTDYRQARILVSLRDGSNATGKKVLQAIDAISSDDPDRVLVAGPGLSKIALAEMVIKGQLISLILSLLIVFFLLTLSFKSWAAGTQGTLSLLLAILFLFGIMGFTGISLDLVTALLSSVMIGVGIDYTIHFLWRYRKEYARCLNSDQALATTLLTAGRGIVFNAFSVMLGFSVLMLSGFTPLRFFGILVVAALMACLLSALLLVPALIKLCHPRILEPQMD